MSAFFDYFTAVYDGRIVACQKMKKQAQRLLEAAAKPGKYHYDERIANKHVDFIEKFCRLPSGRIGQPFVLEPFQKARLQATFGFVDDKNLRQYREVNTIEGRKNGKTSEAAAVELDLLLNDEEGAPQVYNVATKHTQAMLGFNACYRMVRQSPELRSVVRKRQSDLYCPFNMGYIMALASNTKSLDGLDVSGATIDELAAIRNRDLYDLIKQAGSAREQPLIYVISTNGFVRESIFDAQYEYSAGVIDGTKEDERFLPFIYELDSPDEWLDESCWIKANPGLGTIKSYDYLKNNVEKAKQDPKFKPTVLVKDFNIPQTASSAWLTAEQANNTAVEWPGFDYCIGGFDAADSVDLNAATCYCARPDDPNIYTRQMYWIPQRVIDDAEKAGDRKERDAVPYSLWVQQGYMRTYPGTKVDKRVFLDWFCELRDNENLYPVYIFYDPWHIDDSLLREFKANFGENSMKPVRQGVISLSEPMKDLGVEFAEHRVIYQNNPVTKWCLYNTMKKQDINGNIQPVKTTDPRNRIDGAVSLIIAHKGFLDVRDQYVNLNEGVHG